jgi:tetratricopeptide (TPR) repeat protein
MTVWYYYSANEDLRVSRQQRAQQFVDKAWDDLGGKEGTYSLSFPVRVDQAAVNRAERNLRDARAIAPDDVHVLVASCMVSAASNHNAKAHEYCEGAIRKHPNDLDAHMALGTLLYSESRHKEAIAEFRKAVALRPNSHPAHRFLAEALLSDYQMQPALDAATEAIALNPLTALNQDTYGSTLIGAKRFDEALLAFKRAVELDPKMGRAHANLAVVLAVLSHSEESAKEFVVARELDPTDNAPFIFFHRVMRDAGKSAETTEVLERVATLTPNDPHPVIALCATLADSERFALALEPCKKAISMKPSFSPTYFFYSVALRKLGRDQEAREVARQATKLESRNTEGRGLMEQWEKLLQRDQPSKHAEPPSPNSKG